MRGQTAVLAEFFFLALSLGSGFFRPLIDVRHTGVGLAKLMAAVCGGASLLACPLGLVRIGPWVAALYGLAFLGNVCLYFAADAHGERRWYRWGLWGLVQFPLLALVPGFFDLLPGGILPLLNSTLLIGSASFALIMGHWYLITPKLSTFPLRVALYGIWSALAIKLGLLFWPTSALHASGVDLLFEKVLWWMAFLWGHAAVAGLSYLAHRLVKMRSLQSATGIFYSMAFFVFAGELVALYFVLERGMAQ